MRRPTLAAVLAATIPLCLATGSFAQSSLGLNFAEAALTVDGGDQDAQVGGTLSGDYRITGAHGFQLDLRMTDHPDGFLGQIDGHLYLAPSVDRKYGFLFSLADVDGRETTIASAGIEGMVALSDSTFISGRAILGYARPGDIDFIGLSGGITHALNDRTALFATLDVAEFDEQRLQANAYTGRIGMTYQPDGSPFEVTAALAVDGLTGRDSAPEESRVELGFTWRFGATGGARRGVAERAFNAPQPFDVLLRRNLF